MIKQILFLICIIISGILYLPIYITAIVLINISRLILALVYLIILEPYKAMDCLKLIKSSLKNMFNFKNWRDERFD